MAGDKEESGFGFKDRAKAEQTVKLLQDHELQYQRLTVRGLLGRAKRVLSMTKAEDKRKNIKEAMAVFEEWQEKDKESRGGDKESKSGDKEKSAKKKKEDESDEEEKPDKKDAGKADTVPGLGFKDAETARNSIKVLEGRDPDYQKLAVKGLIGRAKRVLTGTRDETKIKSMKEAVDIFEKYLVEFENGVRGKVNCTYLPLSVVEACLKHASERGVAPAKDLLQYKFIEAYRAVGGDYKKLRTVASPDDTTWDIVRNSQLATLKQQSEGADMKKDDQPTVEHLRMALWAYSPLPDCLKSLGEKESRKRKSDETSDGSSKKNKA